MILGFEDSVGTEVGFQLKQLGFRHQSMLRINYPKRGYLSGIFMWNSYNITKSGHCYKIYMTKQSGLQHYAHNRSCICIGPLYKLLKYSKEARKNKQTCLLIINGPIKVKNQCCLVCFQRSYITDIWGFTSSHPGLSVWSSRERIHSGFVCDLQYNASV